MEFNKILRNISKDIAKVQHESDVLSQWPINSVEAMHYSGPFFIPKIGKDLMSWKNDPEGLFQQGIMPGKLAGLVFYFLNEKAKEKMGKENHKNLLGVILSKIMLFKNEDFLEDYTSKTWMPNWNLDLDSKKVDVKKLVFLLDNLTEMVNPIFRSNGVQLFFDDENVYRYYYRAELNKGIIVVSSKKGMRIDFFEHIIEPENLEESQIFVYQNGVISQGEMDDIFEEIKDKINELKNKKDFNREYVVNQIFSAFKFSIPEPQIEFLRTPFPKEILEFYIKTCQIPKEKLSHGIYRVLGGP